MKEAFHLGSYLSKIIASRKMKRSDVTRLMGVHYSAFYGYENRDSLQYSVMVRLAHAMRYNIFLDIANTMPADYDYNKNLTTDKEAILAQMKEENQKLKWENDLLRELLTKKG